MRIRSIVTGMLATVAACSGGNLGNTGSAGTSGAGDAGDAIAGGGGAGGLPACGGSGGGSSGDSGFTVTGSDETAFMGNVTAPVTVTVVDSCGTASCPAAIDTLATRFVLTAADGRTWTLYLRNTAMPSDRVKVGDTYDMTLFGGVNSTFYATLGQMIVLGHGSTLELFASSGNEFGVPYPPNLHAFGVEVTDGGALCQGAPLTLGECTPVSHAAMVTVGTDSGSVPSGVTQQVGWLSFTNSAFVELRSSGACDAKGYTRMAGFRVP